MKILNRLTFVVLSIGLASCERDILLPDLVAPAPPHGLFTETGDGFIELFWSPNSESDVRGYNVFASTSYTGPFTYIGTTTNTWYVDVDAKNGTTYYYAISAFDRSQNESDPSTDIAYDTPRPEGYHVTIADFRALPEYAGYDFSTYSVGPYDDKYTDVFFENYDGALYLDVWEDTDIQDVGFTISLQQVGEAPTRGWSPTKDARIVPGHTYVIWTWDDHYAKLRVTSASADRVVFDWTYQLQPSNTRLKRTCPGSRDALTGGAGFLERK